MNCFDSEVGKELKKYCIEHPETSIFKKLILDNGKTIYACPELNSD